MGKSLKIRLLSRGNFEEAVSLVLKADLDTKEEVEHHLEYVDAQHIALGGDKVIRVIGWYQDNVNYANEAMGDKFPGEEAYWVGLFAVDEGYRGKGVGHILVSKLEQVVKEKGARELWVSSVPETESYYEKQGFEVVYGGKDWW